MEKHIIEINYEETVLDIVHKSLLPLGVKPNKVSGRITYEEGHQDYVMYWLDDIQPLCLVSPQVRYLGMDGYNGYFYVRTVYGQQAQSLFNGYRKDAGIRVKQVYSRI